MKKSQAPGQAKPAKQKLILSAPSLNLSEGEPDEVIAENEAVRHALQDETLAGRRAKENKDE